jgi:hypothetical protein
MSATLEELRTRATELFDALLAEEINAAMEQDATIKQPGPESLATLFLADRFYKKLPTGKLEGRVSIIWNGMDSFIFIPDPQHPLTYTTGSGRKITPRLMDTDGGSIPRLLWVSGKFSPWGYAPAFMIHDWLFIAHKCGHAPDTDWTFPQTSLLMAEVIKTLMEVGYTDFDGIVRRLTKKEDTLYLMYQAVASSIAENLWNDASTVKCYPS